MVSGVLDIVEGAYDLAIDDHRWLKLANERFASRFPSAVASGGYVLKKTAAGPPVFHSAFLSGVEDAMTVFGPMHAGMDPVLAEAVFPTGTHCKLFSEMWATVPAGLGDEIPVMNHLRSVGADDLLYAASFDAAGNGVLLGAMVKAGTTLAPSVRALHQRAAVHMATGLRLRQALTQAVTDDVAAAAEAVFEAGGRLAHAEGPATDAAMRAHLTDAVKRIDHARTDAVRKDEMEALSLWQGLVEGRWSLIDRYDTDGRRYYVAIANPVLGMVTRELSAVEAQVVAQAVAGEPNGVIAYSLGAAESTIANHLANAMRKLGVHSRMELVRLGRALGA